MTGTELLIKAMEQFSTAEPTAAIVIWIADDECIRFMGNAGYSSAIGMAEYAKQSALRQLLKEETEGEDTEER